MKISYKYIIAAVTLLIIGAVLYYFSEIVTYILMAWVVSMIGAPIVVYLRKYLGKNLAAIVTLSLFITGFIGLVYIFIPPLINQVDNLSKVDYNKVVDALHEPLRDWEHWLVKRKLMVQEDTLDQVRHISPDTAALITHSITLDSSVTGERINIDIHLNNHIKQEQPTPPIPPEDDFFTLLEENIITYLNPANIQSIFGNTLNAFGEVFVSVFSIFFIAFFFLREQGLFDNIIVSVVPTRYEAQTRQAVNEISKLLIRYFIGILIQMTFIAVILSVGLTFFGVKNALLIAFFAAIINVIPYIGPVIGMVFGVLLTISSNTDLAFYSGIMPIIYNVLIMFGIVHLIDNLVLQPNIFSKSVKAHPLEIFIIVMMGAKIGGIMGMVLAIPFYTAFRVIGKVFLSEFKVIHTLTRNL